MNPDSTIDLAAPPEQAAERKVGLDRLVIYTHHRKEMLERLIGLFVQQEVQSLQIVDV